MQEQYVRHFGTVNKVKGGDGFITNRCCTALLCGSSPPACCGRLAPARPALQLWPPGCAGCPRRRPLTLKTPHKNKTVFFNSLNFLHKWNIFFLIFIYLIILQKLTQDQSAGSQQIISCASVYFFNGRGSNNVKRNRSKQTGREQTPFLFVRNAFI